MNGYLENISKTLSEVYEHSWIVLLGSPSRLGIVEALIGEGIEIELLILPESRRTSFEEIFSLLQETVRDCRFVSKDSFSNLSSDLSGCAILSVGYPYLLEAETIKRHPICLNVHPTLLPKYRGPTTGAFVIRNNEKFAGSTVHIIEDDPDTGPIVCQSKVELPRFDTGKSMQEKVYALEPQLIVDAFRKLRTGLIPEPQDDKMASIYARKRIPEDSEIDANQSLSLLYDEIRSCDPDTYPAFFYVEGEKVCIRLWRPDRGEDEPDSML